MVKVIRRNLSSRARIYAVADAIVVSIPRSGRTWLRTFLSAYFCASANREIILGRKEILQSDLPKVIFSHDLWEYRVKRRFRDWIRGKFLIPPRASEGKPIILLVRDPRDAIVSLFFLLRGEGRYEGSLPDMIRHPKWGIKSIIEIMNTWIVLWGSRNSYFKLVRYEDCRKNPDKAFRDVLSFLGFDKIDESVLARSLEFSSFDNMKKMEAEAEISSGRLPTMDTADPESFKVRRGKIEGYKDYLDPEDIVYLNAAMKLLDPRFGYNSVTGQAH